MPEGSTTKMCGVVSAPHASGSPLPDPAKYGKLVAELMVKAMLKGYQVDEYPAALHRRMFGVSKAKLMKTPFILTIKTVLFTLVPILLIIWLKSLHLTGVFIASRKKFMV